MKLKFYIILLVLMFVLPSCGSGGGSDTNGVLTLTTPAITGGTTNGSLASVSYTVSYTPPAGKVPNGVVIQQRILNGSGVVVSGPTNFQLTSSNSFVTGFTVTATTVQQLFFVELSIGTMTAGTSVIIPAGT